jgi:glycosyltransferase involved in cell wall biosynthesis
LRPAEILPRLVSELPRLVGLRRYHHGVPGPFDEGEFVAGRPVRVLTLIKGLGMGGAERLLVGLVANGDRSRFEYEVAYARADQAALAGELAESGVPVHALGARRTLDLRWVAELRRLLVRGRYDVLHAHLPYSAALGRLAAASLGRRRPVLVYTEHSLWNRAAVLTKALNGLTVGLDDALFVVSPTARDALPPRLRRRARVVVHGVDLRRSGEVLEDRAALRASVRHELGVDDDTVVALTVSNFRAEKGYDVLLDAARQVLEVGTPVAFFAVGSGPLEASVRAAADEGPLRGRFGVLGRRQDTLRLMVGADLLVLPSRQEGMPVALMEAMSVGLPAVAAAVGGVPDIVTDGREGLLFEPGSAGALAAAVNRLVGDPARRARLASAASARGTELDIAGAARQIEQCYLELLGRRGERR